MVLVLVCPDHSLPRTKLCALDACCQLLCDNCIPQHFTRTGHPTAIYLNPQAMAFFEEFTCFLRGTMLWWAEAVRRDGFGVIFTLGRQGGSGGGSSLLWDEVTRGAVEVLEEHGGVMACNLGFATSNKESAQLYHPEFLRDLYNLITQPWANNGQLILLKMNHHASSLPGMAKERAWEFGFREDVAVQVQKYRQELLGRAQGGLIYDVREGKENSGKNGDTNDRSNRSGEVLPEQKQVSPFRLPTLPVSIRVIESFEQIEPPAIDSKSIASTAPNVSIPNDDRKNPSQQGDQVSRLNQEVQRLLAQNCLLKNEGFSLRQDNRILQQKCESMRAQRRNQPSSAKKHREGDLNGEMLLEIVELEAELNDNRHDLQSLAEFVNQLSRRGVIRPQELSRQVAALRTISMH